MNKVKIFILLAISATTSIYAQTYGHCEAEPFSKRYLTSNFEAAYPKTVKFTCKYICIGNNGEEQITAKSEVLINSPLEDAIKVVCQGVNVKKSRWGYELDSVTTFYAYESYLEEIKAWAFDNVDRVPELEHKKLIKLKTLLKEIASSYAIAGTTPSQHSMAFLKASQVLSQIEQDLPDNTQFLMSTLERLQQINIEPGSPSGDSLTMAVLKSLANWLIPTN
tara:strand:- start:82027 stop:82692 length:666 start_codon:yes stop_codon:yes gene_type:complete